MVAKSGTKLDSSQRRPSNAEDRSTATRRRLLAAASAVLVEGGGGFEIADVAARAGLSVGLSYHYFGSKAGLIAAVVEDYYDRYDAEVMDINPLPGADWAHRERERVERAIDFHYREPLAPLVLARMSREPEVAAVEARHAGRHLSIGARNIQLGQKEGLIPDHLDPKLLVAMMIGGVHHAVSEALVRNPRPKRAWLANEIWESVAALARLPEALPPLKARQARRKTKR